MPKIIIIGAGISGLYAAYILSKEGFDVQVLEASAKAGGRIRTHEDENFANFPVELGAAEVHGRKSVFAEMIEYLKGKLTPISGDRSYYYEGQLIEENKVEEHLLLSSLLSDLFSYERYQGDDIFLEAYLKQKPYYHISLKSIADAFAAEFGTTANRLGIKTLSKEEAKWHSGNRNYLSSIPMNSLVEFLTKELEGKIQYNTEVLAVDYNLDEMIILDQHAKEYKCHKAVVTVPLGILKSNHIHFRPPLPDEKMEAIHGIGFDAGIKVFLKFKEIFWSQDQFEISGGKRCPNYLFPTVGNSEATPMIIAYLMGEKATFFYDEPKERVEKLLLEELDKIFGKQLATVNFVDSLVIDWKRDPYIKGAYSFATPHMEDMRAHLFSNINNKLYFAGEACHTDGHAGTVHGAMETAEVVAQQLLDLSKV